MQEVVKNFIYCKRFLNVQRTNQIHNEPILFLAGLAHVALWLYCNLGSEHTCTFFIVHTVTKCNTGMLPSNISTQIQILYAINCSAFNIHTKFSALTKSSRFSCEKNVLFFSTIILQHVNIKLVHSWINKTVRLFYFVNHW